MIKRGVDMKICIPNRLLKKMTEEHRVECENVLFKYGEIAGNHMYFFDEYTDHSYKHIQYVLETASRLIPNYSLDYLSSTDIFVLVLGILYHDLGMHINFESIKLLYETNPKDIFKKLEFRVIWHDFIKEEVKNSGHNIDELISIDKLESIKYEENKSVVSNFVRYHHSFIANIIAQNGFPGKEGYIDYTEKRYSYLYELSGLVACSHGMDLRTVIEYLKDKYGDLWKTPFGCRAVYLMTLVRIADYLHITDDRVCKYKLLLSNFRSKISEREFLKHQSVYHSQQIYDNSETIYVYSEPEEFEIFIHMNQLIDNIQFELDHSWAILGEVYGTTEIKLTVRRITSNLKNSKWIENSQFIAEKLKFEFDIRLMDLLVEPLYGDNPSYGVRELIQNATDACKSRSAIEKVNYSPKVEIWFKDNEFTIKDNGIGMDVEVIKKYFLKIGSSFSDSKIWSEYNDQRKNKDDQILRNGRFGIGILSSFLIGDIIKVKTRRISSEFVYYFETGKYEQVIEITKKKESKGFVGTEISIPIKNGIDFKNVMIEWYKLNDVSIYINDKQIGKIIDITGEKQNWDELDCQDLYGFKEIKWSHDYKIQSFELNGKKNEKPIKYDPNLLCNGIVIPEKYDKKINSCIVNKWPTILIKDTSGNVDLDLSRNELNSNLPFIKELETQLLKVFSDELKSLGSIQSDGLNPIYSNNQIFAFSNFRLDNFKDQKVIFTKNGYAILNKYFMNKNNINRVIRIWTRKDIKIMTTYINDNFTAYVFEGCGSHPSLKSEIINYKKNIMKPSNACIHLLDTDFADYQTWAANIYRLSQTFIQQNCISKYSYSNNDYMKKNFNIDLSVEDVSLVIDYKYNEIEDDGSHIFSTYFDDMKIIPYPQ